MWPGPSRARSDRFMHTLVRSQQNLVSMSTSVSVSLCVYSRVRVRVRVGCAVCPVPFAGCRVPAVCPVPCARACACASALHVSGFAEEMQCFCEARVGNTHFCYVAAQGMAFTTVRYCPQSWSHLLWAPGSLENLSGGCLTSSPTCFAMKTCHHPRAMSCICRSGVLGALGYECGDVLTARGRHCRDGWCQAHDDFTVSLLRPRC